MSGTGFVRRLIPVLLAFSFLGTGCLTGDPVGAGEPEPAENGPTVAVIIAEYLEAGEPLKALDLYLSRQGDLADSERYELYQLTLKGLDKSRATAVSERKYPEALVYGRTLDFLTRFPAGKGVVPQDPDLKGLELLRIGFMAERGYYAPAALLARQWAESGRLVRSDYQTLYDTLIPSGDVTVLDYLSSKGKIPPRHNPAAGPDLGRMTEGTVTVWVDRGIKVDRGKGTPDIAIGSGFFIDRSGYLLTNYHVIQSEVDPSWKGYSRLYVRLSEESPEKLPARVVGWDTLFDLALLKVEMEAPHVFYFDEGEALRPGQRIRAIGSPAGLMRTVTSGTVSATNRQFLPLGDVVQVDVPINPGNSGGPLLNEKGEIIGVVFAGIEQFEGINFAIPGRYVKKMLPALYEGGAVSHSWLGIACVKEISDLIVVYVSPDSPADRAGMVKGDLLQSVNGIPVDSMTGVQYQLLDIPVGTPVRITWTREGESRSALTVLKERPVLPVKYLLERDVLDHLFPVLFGFEAEAYGNRRFSPKYRVTRVFSATLADEIGFTPGDLITIRDKKTDEKLGVFILEFLYQGQKEGFLDSWLRLASRLETTLFL